MPVKEINFSISSDQVDELMAEGISDMKVRRAELDKELSKPCPDPHRVDQYERSLLGAKRTLEFLRGVRMHMWAAFRRTSRPLLRPRVRPSILKIRRCGRAPGRRATRRRSSSKSGSKSPPGDSSEPSGYSSGGRISPIFALRGVYS